MGLFYDNYQTNYKPTTNNNINNKLNINAISGTLVKTYKDSYIVRFQKGSPMENFYFDELQPRKIMDRTKDRYLFKYDEEYDDWYYKLKDVVVLQVMLMSDNGYLVEAMDRDKFDEMFQIENGGSNE